MSETKILTCNNCDSETREPYYHCKGWMRFIQVDLLIATGEAYHKEMVDRLDFCCFDCFRDFINSLIK